MARKSLCLSVVLMGAALSLQSLSAFADDPPPPHPWDYYVSMRGLTTEMAPSFVSVVLVQNATHTVSLSGCDERTYYATAADATTIAAARAAGEVVQLHRAEPGDPPQASGIMCIIDGSGGT